MREDILANIPKQYGQDAQAERDRKASLPNAKSRGNWGYGDIPADRWPFKTNETKSK